MTHPILRRHGGWAWIVALFAALLLALPAAAQTFPEFTGLVVDDANVLPPEVEADLTAKLESLQKDTKRQLVVATIGDLQGYPLEEYGYKLGRNWGVGLRDVNNGLILFIAPNNPAGQRGPRIEVGRGLEPIVTDALASVIIRQEMIPRLRANGDVPGAMTAGADALIRQLRASPEEAQARLDAATKSFDQTHQRRGGADNGGGIALGAIIPLLVIGFIVLAFFRRGSGGGRRYRGGGGGDSGLGHVILWGIANEIANGAMRGGGGSDGVRGWGSGGGWGGGGGSDGSWGGGGFTGGGGGDFGGGGASGDW